MKPISHGRPGSGNKSDANIHKHTHPRITVRFVRNYSFFFPLLKIKRKSCDNNHYSFNENITKRKGDEKTEEMEMYGH